MNTCCPDLALKPSPPALLIAPVQRLWATWRAWRRAAQVRREQRDLAELSLHTLEDINAPCVVLLQVRLRLELERQHQDNLRATHLVPW